MHRRQRRLRVLPQVSVHLQGAPAPHTTLRAILYSTLSGADNPCIPVPTGHRTSVPPLLTLLDCSFGEQLEPQRLSTPLLP